MGSEHFEVWAVRHQRVVGDDTETPTLEITRCLFDLGASALGGVSMCRMPPLAVIHWVAPFSMIPPPPWESWGWKVPSIV